jgi:hypothetical protein
MASRLNSPLVVVLLVATLVGLFVLGRLHQASFDLSSFIVAGDQFSDPTKVPAGLTVLPNSPGYDGQFYYRLALDPLTAKATDFGITLDTPPFRQQRILYPLVCGIFSAGDPRILPAVMILVNVVALCVMAWIGANYARAFDVHALWGAFLPLHPAFLFSLTRNLVEILEVSLLLGSLLLLRRGRPLLATLSLSLAVLTKETALLVAVAAMVAYAWQWWRTKSAGIIRWYYFAVPIALFILWRGFLSFHWGSFAAYSSGNSLLGLAVRRAGFLSLRDGVVRNQMAPADVHRAAVPARLCGRCRDQSAVEQTRAGRETFLAALCDACRLSLTHHLDRGLGVLPRARAVLWARHAHPARRQSEGEGRRFCLLGIVVGLSLRALHAALFLTDEPELETRSNCPRFNARQQARHATARRILRTRGNSRAQWGQR